LAQKVEYKKFSYRLTKLKTDAKRNYFDNQLKIYQGDSKKTWKLLRSLFPSKSKTSNQTFNTQSTNNQPNLTDKAAQFIIFFCTIGEKLASDIPNHQNQLFSTYLKIVFPHLYIWTHQISTK